MIRVLSQPAYRGGTRSPAEAIATLRQMKETHPVKEEHPWKHVFWADDFSVTASRKPTDRGAILPERIAGARQVTDVYLAAMALRRGGRLVTFDAGVAWQAVEGGSKTLIEVPAV
jgi:predicted nucleic acid-binding protein